jgi:hypothetical protein
LNEVVGRTQARWLTMPSHTNLPIGYGSCWFPGDIMSYPFYHLYCPEPNNGELLCNILAYKFENITKKGRICVIMISFSQPAFMGSKVLWTTTAGDREEVYKRPWFRWRSQLPPIFSTIHCIFRNHQLYWYFVYHHHMFTYDVDERISTEDNQYGSI